MELATVLGDELKKGKFWTDAWSLVEGCTPVSPGCAHCWLAGMYKRNLPNLRADVAGGYTTPTGEKIYRFHGNIIYHEDRLDQPLRAKKPRVYAIWSDLFHESVPVDFLNRAFDTMNRAKHHRFIIITKRPLRAMQYMASWPQWSPMANVIIMVTMEDQKRVQERWKAAVKLTGKGWKVGILAEPLLSPITIDPSWLGMMSWLITGGESGHGARPAHPDWFRSLRDQAQTAGVPFLFKQWGEWAPTSSANYALQGGGNRYGSAPGIAMLRDGRHVLRDLGPGERIQVIDARANKDLQRQMDKNEVDPRNPDQYEWLGYQWVHRLGKVKSGRTLDNLEWLELPAT